MMNQRIPFDQSLEVSEKYVYWHHGDAKKKKIKRKCVICLVDNIKIIQIIKVYVQKEPLQIKALMQNVWLII